MKKWCIDTMEYDSATKKNEILQSTATRMDIEGIVLSEIIQTEIEKDKCQVISPIHRI